LLFDGWMREGSSWSSRKNYPEILKLNRTSRENLNRLDQMIVERGKEKHVLLSNVRRAVALVTESLKVSRRSTFAHLELILSFRSRAKRRKRSSLNLLRPLLFLNKLEISSKNSIRFSRRPKRSISTKRKKLRQWSMLNNLD
jgi:hypothetical protein